MTLKLDRSKCCKLLKACTAIAHSLESEATDDQTNADRRKIAQESAAMWNSLHDEVRAQIDEFDRKKAEKGRGLI